NAFGNGSPIVFHKRPEVWVFGVAASKPGDEFLHVTAKERETDLGIRPADFKNESLASRSKHTSKFSEQFKQAFDVTERIAHHDKIESSFGERKLFTPGLNQRN